MNLKIGMQLTLLQKFLRDISCVLLDVIWSIFQVRASMPFSPWDTEETTVCLTIAGSQILDVYGNNFPAKQICTTLNHRYERPPPY